MAPTSRRILIVGGGPAGSVTAFWLAKAGFDVTIAERSTSRFAYGQGIDITGSAVDIVEKMGLLGTITSKTTGETGFALLDDDGNEIGVIGVAENTKGGQTFAITRQIEIMRGELTRIFANAADAFPNVTYHYGTTITSVAQFPHHVTVTFSSSSTTSSSSSSTNALPISHTQDFALIIGADGLRSQTRTLTFPPSLTSSCIHPLNGYGAYFSIPSLPSDTSVSHFQHGLHGRGIFIRPIDNHPISRCSAYILYTAASPLLSSSLSLPQAEQKRVLKDVFEGFPSLGPRAVKGMLEAEDFYFEQTAQVKMEKWSWGRSVLVGDAGYCPSPLTGQGTALAILGAYVLAGEIVKAAREGSDGGDGDGKHGRGQGEEEVDWDVQKAFESYEGLLRGYVETSQKIPLWGYAPRLLNPRTGWGIWLNRLVFKLFAWSGVWRYIGDGATDKFKLPEYDWSALGK